MKKPLLVFGGALQPRDVIVHPLSGPCEVVGVVVTVGDEWAVYARTVKDKIIYFPLSDVVHNPKVILKTGAKCTCGKPLPWHLIAIAGKEFSHHCRQIESLGGGCGRIWKWKTEESVESGE